MKKLILIASLGLALLMPGLKAAETESSWVWVGTGWVLVSTSGGDDPLPPTPPPRD